MERVKPPKAVAVAVELGVLFLVLVPIFTTRDLGPNGVSRFVSAIVHAVLLLSIYKMRRWAVVVYTLLTILTAVFATATFGLTAWRGLLIGLVLRMIIVGPSLYYWQRLF